MERIIKSGQGWILGWDRNAAEFTGLIGSEEWSIELTENELNEFCRLLNQLAETMNQIAGELMDEEKITLEAESDQIWLEVSGYPHAYSLQIIVQTGRRCEGNWPAEAVPGLLQAIQTIKGF